MTARDDVVTPGVMRYLASAPRGFADLLAVELTALGALEVRERALGVAFEGPLEVGYRACLESRLASRVFLEIAQVRAETADTLYMALRALPWSEHVDPDGTLACDFSGRHPAINHTRYGAQRVKDAICDALRESHGRRPDVALERPSVRVHAHANGPVVTVSIDLSGEGLHRRGYRAQAGEAPLRENVAAGILVRAGWPALAVEGVELLDPMCGSGTIPIEGALIAANIAPGLHRDYYGLHGWKGHDAALWQRLHAAATARVRPRESASPIIRGSDADGRAIRNAQANAARAGVAEWIGFAHAPLGQARPGAPHGLVCTNPPYGVRMEDRETARALHRELGAVLREHFDGWRAAVITGAPDLGLDIGLRAQRTHTVWNGAIECRLLRFAVEPGSVRDFRRSRPLIDPSLRETAGARMFGNRLAKNAKRLDDWAAKAGVGCYRVYDADMPEYAFAIDLYSAADSSGRWAYVQEYAAPREIELEAVRRRRAETLSMLPVVLGLPEEHIHVRMRRRTARGDQYGKEAAHGEFRIVAEGGLRFRINFTDYLDTGLFLDHRITRARLREAATGARFLNLFAYTGSATVYAAAGGARETTSIDLSRTYLDWAQENLALNALAGRQHRFLQADCREWLAGAARTRERFDLIFLDPPTFSNSKRMQGVHDVQRDHPALIDTCMQLLAPGGLLVFSTNAQKFRPDPALADRYAVNDITRATIPEDFARNPRIHSCYEIRVR
ncbi:MAG: bifunctional 23S rRNA (guanine(2069)-N(7))-methyltransferase RlmK/23S rRNA (guanine(2445)-N(2))-methyltransferase RlmL [Steroidobacteraceae bacterium]|nr:bifunctional 23S rRNA (guanine(2069)-N(7))-methyltransferase RlmK/23S rRNA (guanine(2445)-N(2))-methyltransferase RlmL [Steroidobacteraceae bacterium]